MRYGSEKLLKEGMQKAKVHEPPGQEASPLFFDLPFLPKMEPAGRLALPRGKHPTVYKTVAVATEPHRPENGPYAFSVHSTRAVCQ